MLGLAGRAVAVQNDLVIVHSETQPARYPVDRSLKVRIIERHQPPARIADEMVVMLATRIDELVPRGTVAELKSVDQPALAEQLKDAVDTRPSDPLLLAAQQIIEFKRGQRALLAGEQIDQRVTRATLLMPSLIEHHPRVLCPLRPVADRHQWKSSQATSQKRTRLVLVLARTWAKRTP